MWKVGVMQSKHTSVIILFCTFCYLMWLHFYSVLHFSELGLFRDVIMRSKCEITFYNYAVNFFYIIQTFLFPTEEISPSGRTIFPSFLGYSRRRMGLHPNAFIFSTWKNRENFKNNNKLCQRYMETQAPQQYVSIATQRQILLIEQLMLAPHS